MAREENLTRAQVLEAAHAVLRRFGPAKATVVDIARALGVSHASVYRHFASKSELRDAVVEDWLDAMLPPLQAVEAEEASSVNRVERWLRTLITLKRKRASDDPELFLTYAGLAGKAGNAVSRHMDDLAKSLSIIIADGVSAKEISSKDPSSTAWALLHATVRFQNPAHVTLWASETIDAEFDNVWALLLSGLSLRS